jgi:hypothetical protein
MISPVPLKPPEPAKTTIPPPEMTIPLHAVLYMPAAIAWAKYTPTPPITPHKQTIFQTAGSFIQAIRRF